MTYTGTFKGRSNKTRTRKPKTNGKKKKVSKREQLIKARIEVLSVALITEQNSDKRKRSIEEINFLKQQLRSIRPYR